MRMLGVFAHPDDETYSIGGCIARYTDEGIDATILTFTRGEAGQITEGSGATRETLAAVREAELRAACAILGCSDVRIVGNADGGTTVTDDGIAAIARVIEEIRPDVVVTMEPQGVTRHPDHKAVSVMTVAAVAQTGDVVKRLYLSAIPQSMFDQMAAAAASAGVTTFDQDGPLAPRPAPDSTIACVVDTVDVLGRKIEALWAHLTQSQEFIAGAPKEMAEMAMRFEAFQRAIPPFREGDPAGDDLFEGLR